MITEDYVSFEIAKLLEEKGFREKTIACYDNDGKLLDVFKDTCSKVEPQNWNGLTQSEYNKIGLGSWYKSYSAPTLQMAMKWLRKVRCIDIEVQTHYFGCLKPNNTRYYRGKILKADKGVIHTIYTKFTYEEVCEAAIKYYLENLI